MSSKLSLPFMCAPISFSSAVPLAVACCRAGVIGGWQGGTYTPSERFEAYLKALAETDGAPPNVNLPARWGRDLAAADRIALLARYGVPLVLSRLRDPSARSHRSEEHTVELQSRKRSSYDVYCLETKKPRVHEQNR